MEMFGPIDHVALLLVAAFLAGALNAVAGGGSFLTLPALVFTGVPAVTANATGTVALLPGYAASKGAVGSLAFSILQLRMFPPMAILIPIMIMWSTFRLIDTWYGLVIVYGVVTFPFVVWLMKSFFDDIPKELDEAEQPAAEI